MNSTAIYLLAQKSSSANNRKNTKYNYEALLNTFFLIEGIAGSD